MCPDPQILSIYLDGELPSPWKEKMETHLSACPKCKEKLINYKHVQELFVKGTSSVPLDQKRIIVENDGSVPAHTENEIAEVLEKSKEKVWKKLAARQRYNATGLVRKSGNIRNYSVWRRKISMPLPAVAAAVVLVILGSVFYLQNRQLDNDYANQLAEYPNLIEEMPSNFFPAANDMNSVLQYFDSNGADIIILQLPESRNFSRSGEPAIIRAADYSSARRQP